MTTCTCRGYDPADPCMHGDTAQGCPVHDPDRVWAFRPGNDGEWYHVADLDDDLDEIGGVGGPQCRECGGPARPDEHGDLEHVDYDVVLVTDHWVARCTCGVDYRIVRKPAPLVVF